METKIKNIFIGIIVLSGIFYYALVWDNLNAQNENNSFYVAQLAFFMLSAGVLGSILIYEKNKWIGWLGVAYSVGLFKTFLFANASRVYMFESALIGFCGFFIYYFVRHTKLNQDILKWFLIPAVMNIGLVFIQYFDNSLFIPVPVEGVSGFIGREGMTAVYLAMTLPVFFKYFRWGIIPCFVAIVLCHGAVGIVAGAMGSLFYAFNVRTRSEFVLWCVLVVVSCLWFSTTPRFDEVKGNAHLRASMIVGTFDGIKHNPILGWGVGSFVPIVSRITPEDSEYFGIRFNTENAIMQHPHNELLSGWWKIGIIFPILIITILWDFIRKYDKAFIASFTIVLISMVVSMGWFFTLPSLMLLIIAFGVFENSVEA